MIFNIIASHRDTKELRSFVYNNETSLLTDVDGIPVRIDMDVVSRPWSKSLSFDATRPATKSINIHKLKILLGLACNYSCQYCSQRFVPHAVDEGGVDDIESFVLDMPRWYNPTDNAQIEFWGGEPLVYWKRLKPLAELIREQYPQVHFLMVTNGSLLSAERNQWLDDMGFTIGLSHDGPGQKFRGPDPFNNDDQAWAIMDLYERLHPKGRISINTMLNRHNYKRGEIQKWFQNRFGDDVVIAEGGIIDAYDEGGLALLPATNKEYLTVRKQLYQDIMTKQATNFIGVKTKISNFIAALKYGRSSDCVGQKCGMDRPDNIAVTLLGEVVTCQNVSPSSVAPNGQPHLIGRVDDMGGVRLNTARHWSTRDECRKCPVLQLCQGGCMFLEGELWDRSCEAAFNDNIVLFCVAFCFVTGYIPLHIKGSQPKHRQFVWQ